MSEVGFWWGFLLLVFGVFFFFNSEDGDLFFYSCYEAKIFVSISSLLPAIS